MKFFTDTNTPYAHKKNSPAGFTLIEMIVAMSIFIIVMLVIVGALISLDNAARKARAVRLVTDNLSAAVDSMSRNIRMGSNFHCGCEATPAAYAIPKDCASPMDNLGAGGDACFAFEGQRGSALTPDDQIVYQLSNNRVERSVDGGANFLDLTAPELTVTNLRFFVYGSTLSQDQPMVTMLLQGVAGLTTKTATNFNIQTTIGARTPNYAP